MGECEPRRVEELPLEPELARPAVDGVARDRQVDRREMHADLVSPARLELDVEQSVPRKQLDELEVRDSLTGRVRVERMSHRLAAIAADRRLDPAAAGPRPADDERAVVALELAALHELLQAAMSFLRPRDDHQARGVAVEPVHDSGPVLVAAGYV